MTPDRDRGLRLTQQAIGRQLAAMPHDLYLVRLIHNQTRRPLPGQRLWTPAELLDPAIIKFLRIRNREGFDVYIHPYEYDQNAGYILLDLDRADAGVVRLRSLGQGRTRSNRPGAQRPGSAGVCDKPGTFLARGLLCNCRIASRLHPCSNQCVQRHRNLPQLSAPVAHHRAFFQTRLEHR
jgi:hypothetical protein